MIFRVKKNHNYTCMSNHHLRDKDLSLKAKGLLSFMLSLPDDWDYSEAGLIKILKEGRTAVETALCELERFGYLERDIKRKENGRFNSDYTVYEKPCRVFNSGKPASGNQQEINTNNKYSDVVCETDIAQKDIDPSLAAVNKQDSDDKGNGNADFSADRMVYEVQGKNDEDACTSQKPFGEKKAYGPNGKVTLTDAEYARLQSQFPADWSERITSLDAYLYREGKLPYADCYSVICRYAEKYKSSSTQTESSKAPIVFAN